MRLLSYDGVLFEDLEVTPRPFLGLPGEQRVADLQPRRGASPLMIGATDSGRPIPVLFTTDTSDDRIKQARMRRLLSALNVRSDEARALVAEIDLDDNGDGVIDGTATVTVDAICGPWNWWDQGFGIELTFYAVDAVWTETADSTHTELMIDAGNDSFTVTNSGATAASPVIELNNYSGYIGASTKRWEVTVTNDGDLPLERETVMIPITHTGTSVLQFRMLKDGTFYPVTSMMMDSASTWPSYATFPATVDAGESETFEVLQALTAHNDTLERYTRFDGNYSAIDLGFETQTVTSATTTTITVTGANWPVNRWKRASVAIVSGTGALAARNVLSNTADTLTLQRALITAPDATSTIALYGGGWQFGGGRASSGSISSLTDASGGFLAGSLAGAELVTVGGTGAGQTRTIYGNSSTILSVTPNWATNPDATTEYVIRRPGYHRYYVEYIKHAASQRGGWQINKRYTMPSKTLWGSDILSAWAPFLLNDNSDDFNQLRWTEVNLGGSDVDYFPNLNASRWRGTDRRRQEEGLADGVAIYHPWGYDFCYYDYQIQNTNGVGKFVFAGREAGGDEFELYFEDSATYATLTAAGGTYVDLSEYGNPTHLYMGAQPADDVEISREASESDVINVQWGDELLLFVNTYGKFSYSVGSMQTTIPIEDEIRIGDYALQIGMRDGQRLYLNTGASESLHLDCAAARAWIEDSGGTETRDVTYAVTPVVYDADGDTMIADHWPVLEPGSNTVTFTSDVWTLGGGFDTLFTWREKVFG